MRKIVGYLVRTAEMKIHLLFLQVLFSEESIFTTLALEMSGQ
jgi:hypothetical protein